MGHPEISNQTPFAVEPVFVSDADGRPLLVLVTKATYDIELGRSLSLAEEQLPLNATGERWGKPEESSYKYEPEASWLKPGTDVALIGHAWAPETGTTTVDVAFSVGPLKKFARVFGDRIWFKSLGSVQMTPPRSFERVPLIYERAFGGWDRSHADESRHGFEPRNPVGRGYRRKGGTFEEGLLLPNIEDLSDPIKRLSDKPPPTAFGFTSPEWQPRAAYAGTYDARWVKERSPLLPTDFDRRFLNSASLGLTAPGYLRGDEAVRGVNLSKSGQLAFNLPGEPPPVHRVGFRRRPDAVQGAFLDTVIVDTDDNKLVLLWRSELSLSNGPQDVAAIETSSPRATSTERRVA